MAQWTTSGTATLKARKANSGTDSFTFTGINANTDTGGTPEQYLAAANRLLEIAGTSATIKGMTLTSNKEVEE